MLDVYRIWQLQLEVKYSTTFSNSGSACRHACHVKRCQPSAQHLQAKNRPLRDMTQKYTLHDILGCARDHCCVWNALQGMLLASRPGRTDLADPKLHVTATAYLHAMLLLLFHLAGLPPTSAVQRWPEGRGRVAAPRFGIGSPAWRLQLQLLPLSLLRGMLSALWTRLGNIVCRRTGRRVTGSSNNSSAVSKQCTSCCVMALAVQPGAAAAAVWLAVCSVDLLAAGRGG
jgi:hypothetical protein